MCVPAVREQLNRLAARDNQKCRIASQYSNLRQIWFYSSRIEMLAYINDGHQIGWLWLLFIFRHGEIVAIDILIAK